MTRFWSRLAVELGKRAGLVSVIGLLVTLILGFGITRLDFATGQDSYLNKSDQVYKDNVAYQSLFGGQAMLTVITMDPGHTVDELFTAARPSSSSRSCTTLDRHRRLPGHHHAPDGAGVLELTGAESGRQPGHEHRGQGDLDRARQGDTRVAAVRRPQR